MDIVARLDEFTLEEWREVARRLRPDLTDEQFGLLIDGYFAMKRQRALQ